MAVRITLTDGSEFIVEATLDEWDKAFRGARSKDAPIEIELADGSIRPVDPRSVVAFREEPEAESALREQFQSREPAAAAH